MRATLLMVNSGVFGVVGAGGVARALDAIAAGASPDFHIAAAAALFILAALNAAAAWRD